MSDVETYLSNISPQQRAELERIRTIVKRTVPDAEETISYGMPAFKYKKRPLLYYGAFKHHMSLFPTSEPTGVLKDKLTNYTVSKGTIQFTLEKPLPESLLKEIINVHLASILKASE